MRRIVTMATAALFIAAMTSPGLAHMTKRKHSHKKPIATQPVENTEAGKAKEPQPPPVESLTQKMEAPAPTRTPAETKPAPASVPNQPSMTDEATGMAKDKATGMVKEKTTDTVMDTAKPSSGSVPSMPESNPAAAAKPLTDPASGTPK